MKIFVNGTPLLAPLTGIGQYIRHLFTAMEKVAEADIRMYYGTHIEKGMRPSSRETTAKTVQRSYEFIRRYIPRPRALKKLAETALFKYHTHGGLGGTLYHEPNYVPLPYSGPTVITVCDLSCFDHPETHPEERVRIFQRDMPTAIEKADHIIVISKSTGDALQRWFNVDPQRITNTYLAADPRFHPRSAALLRSELSNLGLNAGAYTLCVGTLEPRKNLLTLFSAFAGLPATLRQQFPLVVAGMNGWGTETMLRVASEMINKGELRLLGYVPDEAMPSLYAGAAAFCYPSRYEGFGLPALEAMASGVPVITSNRTSLPEVVGDAGLMVDPDDVDGLRESLRQLLEDRIFAAGLAAQGLARAQTFHWDKCARETFSVYQKVMRQHGYAS